MTLQDLIEELLDMPTSEFVAFVRDNVGNEEEEEVWGALLAPQLAQAARDALIVINRDLEAQLGQRKAKLDAFQNECFSRPNGRGEWFEEQGKYNNWKARTIGFKRIVLRRLEEAKQAAAQANREAAPHRYQAKGQVAQPNVTKIRHNIRSLFDLAWAVHQHRQACLQLDILPEAHDLKLWGMLDTVTAYSAERGAQPLSEWLEHAMSQPDFTPPPERP